MTQEEARWFFGRPRRIASGIRQREMQIEELKGSLLPHGIRYDGDKVQTSPDDMLSRVMARIDELEREIEEMRKARADALVDVGRAIEQVRDPLTAEIMTEFFVNDKKAADIAEERNYTMRWIHQRMQDAIEEMKGEAHGDDKHDTGRAPRGLCGGDGDGRSQDPDHAAGRN